MATKHGISVKTGMFHIEDNPLNPDKPIPGFIKSMAFQDEYEATFVLHLWLEYEKGMKIKKEDTNYGEFQSIIRMTFRLMNSGSVWAK